MALPVFQGAAAATAAFTDTITLSSFDPGSNNNRCILAVAYSYGSVTAGVSSIKYNSIDFTGIGSLQANNPNDGRLQMWYLIGDSNIATGAHNIVLTFTGGTTTHGMVMAAAFYNVDGTTGVGSPTFNTAASQSPSWSGISGATGELGVVLGQFTNGGHTLTGGSGVTKEYDSATGMYASIPFFVLSKASAASLTIDGSISSTGDNWSGIGVSLKGSSGGTAARIMTMGMG